MSKIGLIIPLQLKIFSGIKKGVWRSWVLDFEEKTQENIFFPGYHETEN